MHEHEETQEIADARVTRDLVLAAALGLAHRAVEHIEAHEEVAGVRLDETLAGGGFDWHLQAHYGRGHSFVRVDGHPAARQQVVHSIEALAAIMGNEQAAFSANVPRAWIESAWLRSQGWTAGPETQAAS